MLRQEMYIGYFDKIHRPGEKLGIDDNAGDFDECTKRTHCNTKQGTGFCPGLKWDEEKGKYILDTENPLLTKGIENFHNKWNGKWHTVVKGGGQNNVFHDGYGGISFIDFKERIPDALMQDVNGNFIELHDKDVREGRGVPMPAIDDPELLRLYSGQLSYQAKHLLNCHYAAGYVLGAEVTYPEYFGLGYGDYRPTSWKHFTSWCRLHGKKIPEKAETLVHGSKERKLWLHFREQAMADRASFFYRTIINIDNTHLVYYPTHGSMMIADSRAKLGQQSDSLAAACDGIEMGHILIDDDAERRNVIWTAFNTSYGVPVIVPRLGNRTADLGMAGGGRSFTPARLRRFLYELFGMGIHLIQPIHWRLRNFDGEWRIKDTPAEEECRRVFDEFTLASTYTMGMGRLQPEVGILAADDTWITSYNIHWTALIKDMLAENVNCTLMTDKIIEPGLSKRMPLILAVNDSEISEETLIRLTSYMNEGGKLIVWGDFAIGSDGRETVLSHKNCLVSSAPANEKLRMIRETLHVGYDEAVCSNRFYIHNVDYKSLRKEMEAFAPNVILSPFVTEGDIGKTSLFPLTDRAALGCICVNNGLLDATFTITPDERLMKNTVPIDMLTGKEIRMPITIPGQGTAMIFFGEKFTEELEDVVCKAEDTYARWKYMGANVGAVRHHFASMMTGLYSHKRYAHAKAMLSTIAIRHKIRKDENGDITVFVDCLDADGKAVENAYVSLRMIPGSMKLYVFEWNGECYERKIKRDDIAHIYNPDTVDYEPMTGVMRMLISAETDTLQGGCLINTNI